MDTEVEVKEVLLVVNSEAEVEAKEVVVVNTEAVEAEEDTSTRDQKVKMLMASPSSRKLELRTLVVVEEEAEVEESTEAVENTEEEVSTEVEENTEVIEEVRDNQEEKLEPTTNNQLKRPQSKSEPSVISKSYKHRL